MKVRFWYLVAAVIALLVLLRFVGQSKEGFQSGGGDGGDAGTFTMYYADWCPHCQAVKPAFMEWAKNGFVTVAGRNVKVDMVQPEKEPEKVKGVKVKGYPTFILMTAEGKQIEHTGDRTPEGYLKFLEESLGNLNTAAQN